MSTVKIYRFEKNNRGIYAAKWYHDYIGDIMNNYGVAVSTEKSPAPFQDNGMRAHEEKIGDSDFYFGFSSIEMMLNWFCLECIEELMEIAGVILVVLELPEYSVFSSEKQCIFRESSVLNRMEVNSFVEAKRILNK